MAHTRHDEKMPDDVEARFLSRKSYAEAFALIGGKSLGTRNLTALTRVGTAAAAAGITDPAPTGLDRAQVHKSLINAWSTEVLLALPGQWADEEDEFIRLANTWGVVQAYYVGYHATQALVVAKGMNRPTNHQKTQQQYATLWADRPLGLSPWTFGAAHDGWRNLPPGETIDSAIHPWSACTDQSAWSLVAKALGSTREAAVKESRSNKRDAGRRARRKVWQDAEDARLEAGKRARPMPPIPRPRLSAVEKSECNRRVRTYTLLDYFYRLRIGANYDEAAVFTDGPTNDSDSTLLHHRVTFLAAGMSLLAELRIRDLVGTTRFRSWADTFIGTSIPAGYDVGIAQRRPLL